MSIQTKTKKVQKVKEVLPEDECTVCCTEFNKSNYKKFTCPIESCSYNACVTCVKTYLLNNPLSEPHCMACKKPYNMLYLFKHLTKTWYETKYEPYKINIKLDIELAKLPEAMEEAEKRTQAKQLDKKMEELIIERNKMWEKMGKQIDSLKKQKNALFNITTEKKVFIQPCSFQNCNGMLSTHYKCGLCDKYTCKECNEPLLEEHKCNPDMVATNMAIKKETKPCPSCNSRIYKIEGCDQMWCTNCKTPFSWITGQIIPAGQILHNPHAIDFLKSRGGNIRAPGDLVCGGLISNAQFKKLEERIMSLEQLLVSTISGSSSSSSSSSSSQSDTNNVNNNIISQLVNIKNKLNNKYNFQFLIDSLKWAYNISEEISNNKLRVCRERLQEHASFNEERVRYILKEIDKRAFEYNIEKSEQQKKVNTSLSFIWEFVSTFGIEMFASLYNYKENLSNANSEFNIIDIEFIKLIINKLIEFNALIKYANSQLAIISVSNSCSVYNIHFSFNLDEPLNIKLDRRNSHVIIDNIPILIFSKERYSFAQLTKKFNYQL
jgi:hypothetical protein